MLRALVDSNVILSAIVSNHQHHSAGLRALAAARDAQGAIAAHSLSEAYSQGTRLTAGSTLRLKPDEIMPSILRVAAQFELLTLSASQSLAAIERFAALGGVGARLYDYLIGEVARVHGIPAIVTWNTAHFASLFPDLRVLTPDAYLSA